MIPHFQHEFSNENPISFGFRKLVHNPEEVKFYGQILKKGKLKNYMNRAHFLSHAHGHLLTCLLLAVPVTWTGTFNQMSIFAYVTRSPCYEILNAQTWLVILFVHGCSTNISNESLEFSFVLIL